MPIISWIIISLLILIPGSAQQVRAETIDLAQATSSWTGEANYDNAGVSINSVGDVNGDGYEDILIGAHNNDEGNNNAGKVYLIWGKEKAWQRDNSLTQADVSFIGEMEYDNAGIAIAYAGDVNGDGLGDFLIGAPNNDERGENTGKVYLFFGKKEGWAKKIPLAQADAALLGERPGDSAGNALSFAGDVNGDGYDDFLVGAKNNDDGGDNSGKCYLVLGKAGNWDKKMKLSSAIAFIGEDRDDKAGENLSFAGDVNGDGYDDFIIGAPSKFNNGPDSGKCYLILGRAGTFAQRLDLSRADASFFSNQPGEKTGNAISFAGDVNQDGLSDFIIGADGNSDRGKATGKCYLFFGKEKNWKRDTPLSSANIFFYGEKAGDHFGSAVAYAGDVKGQGTEGFLISASRNDEAGKNAGKIYIFNAKTSWAQDVEASSASATILGEKKYEYIGNSLAYGGDINADGLPDLLFATDTSNKGGRLAGQIYLLLGKPNIPPLKINQADFKTDATFKQNLTTQVEAGDTLYLQIQAEDLQKERSNVLEVIASTQANNSIKVQLVETKPDSGIFRGKFQLNKTSSNNFTRKLAVKPGDTISITLKNSPKVYAAVNLKVSYHSYIIDDDAKGKSSGNNNGHLEAGETVELSLVLANNYFKDLTDVTAEITSTDKQIETLSGKLNFGAIPSKQIQAGLNKALLKIAPDCPPGHILNMRVTVKTKKGLQWKTNFTLPVEKMVAVSGQLKNRLTNLPLETAAISIKGQNTTLNFTNGQYQLYLPQGERKETLIIKSPGHLNLKKEIDCSHDQKTDIFLVPRQTLSASPVVFEGESSYDSAGDVISYAGDVNGDGYDDFLIGAWGNDEGGSDAGKVYLIFGRAGGWDKRVDLTRADASFIGEARFDEAGRGISYAGDVNGDGYDDFLIGAPNNDKAGDKTGQTYLFFGKPDGWRRNTPLSAADASFLGVGNHDRSGSAVSNAGDVNGDGYDDFLIGAWANDANGDDAGAAYLIFGKPDGWRRNTPLTLAKASWVGETARDEAGKGVASAGDVNGDGYDDFLIGAPSNSESKDFAGKVFLILGRPFGWSWKLVLNQADASFLGEDTNDSAGNPIGYIGDVNGDGFADFAVGAWSSDANQADAGQVYIFFGKKEIWPLGHSLSAADASFVGETSGDAAGLALAPAGDVNGDGFDDLLIGAWRNKFQGIETGQTYLFYGRANGWRMRTNVAFAARSYLGKSSGAAAGRAVAFAGDVNGDGYDDFLIGAKGEDTKGTDSGETYLILADPNTPPEAVTALKVTLKDDLSDPNNMYQGLNIELAGVDADSKKANVAEVLLTSTSWPHSLKLRLHENSANSGIFQGKVRVTSTSSNYFEHRILAYGTATVTVSAKDNGAIYQKTTITDIAPPFVDQRIPDNGATQAPVGGQLEFHIKELGTGVDKNSIVLWVNEERVEPKISGHPSDYRISYTPPDPVGFAQQVVVRIEAQDLSTPPHKLMTGYSFLTANAGVLLNQGFEEGFKHWHHSDAAGAMTSLDNNISHSGRTSCRIDFLGREDINYNHLFQGPVPVQPNTSYLLKAYMKSESLNTMQGTRLYIEGSSKKGSIAPNDPGYITAHSGQLWDTSDWSQMNVSFKTSEHTRYVYVYVRRWSSGEPIFGKCWVDDFYLKEQSEPGFGWENFIGGIKEFFR